MLYELEHRGEPVKVVAIRNRRAASFEEGWIETWDLDSGQRLASFQAVPEATYAEVNESVPPDLRVTTYDFVPVLPEMTPIAFNSDGSMLAVGGSFFVRFFNAVDGQRSRDDLLLHLPRPDGTFRNTVASVSLRFSDGDRVIVGSSGSLAVTFEVATGRLLDERPSGEFGNSIPTVASVEGLSLLASGEIRASGAVGSLAEGDAIITPFAGSTDLAVSRDGKRMAVSGPHGVGLLSTGEEGADQPGDTARRVASVHDRPKRRASAH